MGEKSTVYRRWTLHGFGHMLGIDVHDCANARSESYRDGKLQETKALIPDRCYATMYKAIIEDCQQHGAFDPATGAQVTLAAGGSTPARTTNTGGARCFRCCRCTTTC